MLKIQTKQVLLFMLTFSEENIGGNERVFLLKEFVQILLMKYISMLQEYVIKEFTCGRSFESIEENYFLLEK